MASQPHRRRPGRRLLSRFSRPRRPGGSGRGDPRRARGGAALSPAHAADRQAVLGPNEQLRSLGWVSDETGYRYQSTHPDTGRPWPPIPAACSPPGPSSRQAPRRPRPASSMSTTPKRAWACTRTATSATFGPDCVAVARGSGSLPHWRAYPRRADPLVPARVRRRRHLRRPRAPRLPRRRPHHSRAARLSCRTAAGST